MYGSGGSLDGGRPLSTFHPAAAPIGPADVEWRILAVLGYSAVFLTAARATATAHGLTLAEELIRSGHLDPRIWWQRVAETLSLRFYPSLYLLPFPETASLPPLRRVRQALGRSPGGPTRLYIAPRGAELDRLAATLAAEPSLRGRYAVASPIVISRAVADAYAPAITRRAIETLRRDRPDMSASDARTIRHRLFSVMAVALSFGLAAPAFTILILNTVFLALGGMRLASAYHRDQREPPSLLPDDLLPTYSVLVPLYREANVVPSLVASLARLDYPRYKLSILVLLEADDLETIAAARKACRGTSVRLIVVPPSLPRTKPKALNWALPFVDSDLVTIYDAEDRPASDQLRVAAAAFAGGGDDLVCVQAILEVDHLPSSRSWISRQFALEYAVLFRSLLPWLAAQGLFLPLGGTSNHFRRSALMAAGGWDPFNVTEDADLALRLVRLGGRIGTIASTTSEEAPLNWRQWHYQRVRWMKGWLQTTLVHFGRPLHLLRQVGPIGFGLAVILIPGQVAAAVAFPFGLLVVGLELCGFVPLFADRPFSGDIILSLHLVAFLSGWLGAFMAIVRTARRQPGRMQIRSGDLFWVPIYWLLLFIAALAAPIELIRRPFRWNKTSHGLAARRGDVGSSRPASERVPTRSGRSPGRRLPLFRRLRTAFLRNSSVSP